MKSNLRRIVCLTLTFMLLFSTTVFAFTDVSEKDWFYKDVATLQERGIISGYADNTFKPYNNISNGEALKMIMSIAGITVNTSPEGTHWASNYYIKALELGLLPAEREFDLNQFITRQAVVDIIVKTIELDISGLNKKLDNFKDTQDVNANILANAGIISGFKETDGFYFRPNNLITRAEISAILVRTQNYKLNLLKSDVSKKPVSEISYIELQNYGVYKPISDSEITFTKEPTTFYELEKVLLYMASDGIFDYTIKYESIGMTKLKDDYNFKANLSKAFNKVFSYYPEYFSLTNRLTYKMTGTDNYVYVTISLSNSNFETTALTEMYNVFVEKTTNIVVDLIKENRINNNMSQSDKAKVLFDWVAENTEYDRAFNNESYTGYGQIVNKKAVCQGYTATYNYMCKLLGIQVHGITGDAKGEHIWTVAILDGNKVHIDSTWGDSSGDGTKPNYSYFAATSEFMKGTHKWDSEKFGI